MKHPTTSPRFPFLSQATVAVALVAACASASALPQFTFDPAAAGLLGTNITADNILVSSFMTVSVDPSGNFTQSGYLPITGFQLGDTDGTAAELFDDGQQQLAVHEIESDKVDIEHAQRGIGHIAIDETTRAHLGEVPYPAQQAVGDTWGTA